MLERTLVDNLATASDFVKPVGEKQINQQPLETPLPLEEGERLSGDPVLLEGMRT